MSTEVILAGFGSVVVLLLTLAGVLFNRWMNDLSRKISSICQSNEKAHDELWRDLKTHDHWIKSDGGDGFETAGVILEGR